MFLGRTLLLVVLGRMNSQGDEHTERCWQFETMCSCWYCAIIPPHRRRLQYPNITRIIDDNSQALSPKPTLSSRDYSTTVHYNVMYIHNNKATLMEILTSENVWAHFRFAINFRKNANIWNLHSWFLASNVLRSEFSDEIAYEIVEKTTCIDLPLLPRMPNAEMNAGIFLPSSSHQPMHPR